MRVGSLRETGAAKLWKESGAGEAIKNISVERNRELERHQNYRIAWISFWASFYLVE